MREDLLHFIWKYKKLQLTNLATVKNEVIIIEDVGTHNHLSGPDFFNARINIDGQLWAGNVEIHINSSDWFAHNHEKDPNYNNVILHVVWEDNTKVFNSDNIEIPTLELKDYISVTLLNAYENLFDASNTNFINCEDSIAKIDSFILHNWFERLYYERLERKSIFIEELLLKSQNDWEKVMFAMLLKNFGLKINGESFFQLAEGLNFSIIRKTQSNAQQLESVLMGMAGLLREDNVADPYYIDLKNEFKYLKHKYDLTEESVRKPEFFKLRPLNFPTIRLSQFAMLYAQNHNIFSQIIQASTLNEIYEIFDVCAGPYWNTHFTFGKKSKKSAKRVTKNFVDLIIINTVLPVQFCYAKHLGNDVNEAIVEIISSIKKEANGIISNFQDLSIGVRDAKDSQAILQLYNEYCTKNKCLQCSVGNTLLQRNS